MQIETQTPSHNGHLHVLFAKTTRSFGTNAAHAIFSTTNPDDRMTPVTSTTPRLLQRLISAGANGVPVASLDWDDRRALADLEYIGLRVARTRRPGFVVLIGSVVVADQRTPAREVA